MIVTTPIPMHTLELAENEVDYLLYCMADSDGDGWGDASPLNANTVAGTDCDDLDANLGSTTLDADCDGANALDEQGATLDCDDNDPASLTILYRL